MARKKKKPFDGSTKDLDLVPIMNLVVCLIPMVLASSAAVKVGIININAPKFGQGAAAPDTTEEKPLGLTIAVGKEGFYLTATGADINTVLGIAVAPPPDVVEGAAPPPPAGLKIAMKGEAYDYAELYNKMVVIKGKFPEESIFNLTADKDVAFKYLVTVIDALRVKLDADSFSDIESFQNASALLENNVTQLLWPDVVFAVAQ